MKTPDCATPRLHTPPHTPPLGAEPSANKIVKLYFLGFAAALGCMSTQKLSILYKYTWYTPSIDSQPLETPPQNKEAFAGPPVSTAPESASGGGGGDNERATKSSTCSLAGLFDVPRPLSALAGVVLFFFFFFFPFLIFSSIERG